MKNYKSLQELLKDYKAALEKEDNNFSKYTLKFLKQGPQQLVDEYKQHPLTRLANNRGDWFFVWINTDIKINDDWLTKKNLSTKLLIF